MQNNVGKAGNSFQTVAMIQVGNNGSDPLGTLVNSLRRITQQGVDLIMAK